MSETPASPAATTSNPLLRESDLPLGFPRFDLIRPAHFLPAFRATMAEHLARVDAIANCSATPSFENTLAALERASEDFDRVSRIFSNLVGAHGNDELRAIETTLAPTLAAHHDAIRLNAALFARIRALHEQRGALGLDAESKWLVERIYTDFVRGGANLEREAKDRLRALNQEIAALETEFAQNVQKESNASAILVADAVELQGLAPAEIAATAAAAKASGHAGGHLIELVNTSGQPTLGALENRGLRQCILEASLARCSHGGQFDNRGIVSRLARLRAERARLLGYASHAAYVLEDQMARTPERVQSLLAELAVPALENARREAAEIQALIDREPRPFHLEAWDWDFYAEKVRKARHDFDEAQLRPYLEVDRVLKDGVFHAATRLFGLTFHERKDLPVYEPSVRVFEVHDADGSLLALFIADLYARPTKRGGAWMNSYQNQSGLLGTKPVIGNHMNIPRPAVGEPALLTFDEVTTLFHEFGHALHGMLSQVRYPRFTGTEVPRDFVEFPSQVNEMWATWPEVVKNYARHYKTGEPMPQALLDKMLATARFNQGFRTTEYLEAALLDQAWHRLAPEEAPSPDGVPEFEQAALRDAGVAFAPIPPRYRSTYFVHVFNNEYSAGYYSYIWAEVLDADSVEWFKQHGGLTRENGEHLRRTVLSRGGTADAMSLFRAFAGREPSIEPLLKRRGLAEVRR